MTKNIWLILFCTLCNSSPAYSQISKNTTEHMTAYGIFKAIEPANRLVMEKGKALIKNFPGDYNIEQICAVFDYFYRGWKYKSDPDGMEYFEKGSEGVTTLTGDCDDYSIAMISLIESIGWDGRIICVSGHAYPELYLGMKLSENEINDIDDEINNYYENFSSRNYCTNLNYHVDEDGSYWLNLDYQDNRPGGCYLENSPDAEHLIIYSNGMYRLAYLNNK